MKVIQTKFTNEIRKRVEEQLDSLVGSPSPNMHDYGKRCGYISGLKDAARLLDELWNEYFHTLSNEDEEML